MLATQTIYHAFQLQGSDNVAIQSRMPTFNAMNSACQLLYVIAQLAPLYELDDIQQTLP